MKEIRLLKNDGAEIETCIAIIAENYPKELVEYARQDIEFSFRNDVPKRQRPVFFVLEDESGIVALGALSRTHCDLDICEAFWYNVRKDKQKQGFGRAFIEQTIALTKKTDVDIVVTTCEHKNEALYKKFGFETVIDRVDGFLGSVFMVYKMK